jgi:nucleoside-diphosphate-sugar epimerase
VRFLVTGSHGCIGAWTVHELLAGGREVVGFDLSTDPRRLRLLLGEDAAAAAPHVAGDIADAATLERALDEHEITNVIHLAALQVPFCRADPALGARVNVVGTVNVLEAAKRRRDRIGHVVYASSVAAFDAGGTTMSGWPGTIYGVYKRANEASAAVYWQDERLSSIGLRPHTVYGVGRDQGLTSAPTAAMLAAAAGRPFAIPYGGRHQLQLARDAARALVAASLAEHEGAAVHNLPGPVASIGEVVSAIEAAVPGCAGTIEAGEELLPFPAELDAASFAAVAPDFAPTPLAAGVDETVGRFRELLAAGLLT